MTWFNDSLAMGSRNVVGFCEQDEISSIPFANGESIWVTRRIVDLFPDAHTAFVLASMDSYLEGDK